MKDDSVYVKHIWVAISKIEKYVEGVKFPDFIKDDMRIDAVLRELEIVGEAAGKTSEDFREKHKLPWREMVRMRNKLIHEYFGVDLKIVWDTCRKDIPKLKSLIKTLM